MPNISTQKPSSKELEMFNSIEDQEPSSRVSRFPTGQPLKRDMAGNTMPSLEKLGIMLCTIYIQNGLQLNSLVREWNQTLLNGSDLNNGEKVSPQDSSTMKFQSQPGLDMVATLTNQKKLFIHSLRLIKIKDSYSV